MRSLKLLLVTVLSFVYLVGSPVIVKAVELHPYLKVTGGDVFAGGWINNGNSDCSTSTSSNYQAPTIAGASVTNPKKGGILAYAVGRTGASSDFGAFAMGLIEGDSTKNYGFYTGQTTSTSGLSFANNNLGFGTTYWGGYFAGASQQTHCIPDYFGTKQVTATITTVSCTNLNVASLPADGQYKTTPSGTACDITAGVNAAIGSGNARRVTLFVYGDAYISHSITYQGGYTTDQTPKFTLVAQGNIFVDKGVSNLAGLYIAQPNLTIDATGTNSGSFWTCHTAAPDIPTGHWIYQNCGTRLTIDGAVIAKQLDFVRIPGDVLDNNANPAEVINYTPEMVMGGPFFNPPATTTPKINSLISLPPVF